MDTRDPDIIGYQVINMMFPPDDQPNLAEQGDVVEEPVLLDKIGD